MKKVTYGRRKGLDQTRAEEKRPQSELLDRQIFQVLLFLVFTWRHKKTKIQK